MLESLIRVGRVSSINPAAATARVAYEDRSKMVSAELPVLVRGSRNNKDYWMPDPGEQVLCLFLPNGRGQGYIVGSFYSAADSPPVTTEQKRSMIFADGTKVEYDTLTSTLTIDARGPVNIIAAGGVTVTGDVIADGISLKHHTHGGVQTGSGSSGPPKGG